MAKRYDQRTKEKVVSFVKQYNAKHGRGGQSAAVKKFSINPITVRSWLDTEAETPPQKVKSRRRSKEQSTITVLERMREIQVEIGKLQRDYNKLKSSL